MADMVFLNVRVDRNADDPGLGVGLVPQVPSVGDWFECFHKQEKYPEYCGYVQSVQWQYAGEECSYENRMYATIVVSGPGTS